MPNSNIDRLVEYGDSERKKWALCSYDDKDISSKNNCLWKK